LIFAGQFEEPLVDYEKRLYFFLFGKTNKIVLHLNYKHSFDEINDKSGGAGDAGAVEAGKGSTDGNC
jgi:hypothetical protein